jgi:hypothetical protein
MLTEPLVAQHRFSFDRSMQGRSLTVMSEKLIAPSRSGGTSALDAAETRTPSLGSSPGFALPETSMPRTLADPRRPQHAMNCGWYVLPRICRQCFVCGTILHLRAERRLREEVSESSATQRKVSPSATCDFARLGEGLQMAQSHPFGGRPGTPPSGGSVVPRGTSPPL